MKVYIYIFFMFISVTGLFARTVSLDSYNTSVSTFEILEFTLNITNPVTGNPFTEAHVSAEIQAPNKTFSINGFCDAQDGTIFRVRFTPMRTGNHSFTITFTDTAGTETFSGSFDASEGGNNGFIKVDSQNPTRFAFSNGGHPYIISKTAWLIAGIPKTNYQQFIDKMVPRGENCLRFGLEFDYSNDDPYVDVWPYEQPREAQNFTEFDIDYWRNLDELLTYAAERNIYAEPVLFTLMKFSDMADSDVMFYIDYLVARTASYPSIIMYQLANERISRYDFQTVMADRIHNNDPYGHLVSTSHGTTMDAAWPDAPWMDVAINHACYDDEQLSERYYAIANTISGYNMPGWCDETGREDRHGNDDGVHRRKQYWTWNMGGSYFNYHSWEGCEGIMDISYNGPGSQYLKYIRSFWTSTDFWKMRPNNNIIKNNPDVQYEWAVASDDEVVVYLVNEATGQSSSEGTIDIDLPAGHTYVADFYNPSNGEGFPQYRKSRLAGGTIVSIAYPSFTNDLVLHCFVSDDTQAPQQSSVSSSNVSQNQATISWSTNENSEARVEYGLTTNYGRKTYWDVELKTSHSFTLNNLMPGTEYHYRVMSMDMTGNSSVSSDYTFTTPGSSAQPAISSFSPTTGNMTTEVTIQGSHLMGSYANPMRLMLLGQSEVRGVTGSTDSSGYRNDLANLLFNKGIGFHFIGSQADGTAFDALHEGHDNDGVETLTQNVGGYISQWSPDYMLIYAGAQDLDNGQTPDAVIAELETLLDAIYASDSNIIMLLGNLLPHTDATNSDVQQLNGFIETLITAKKASNYRVFMADQYQAFTDNANWASELMHDKRHPNDTGYGVMALAWQSALQAAWTEFADIEISFAGTAVTEYSIQSEQKVLARVPNGASNGKISITTPYGSVESSDNFITSQVEGNFTANVTTGYAPLIVRFSNLTEGEMSSFEWNFGDGSKNSTEQNPGHVFTKAGTYTITLTVSDGIVQDTETKTGYIKVQERSNVPLTPKWVYEPWVWEDNINTQAGLEELVQGYLDRDIPVGAVNIDSPWETEFNTFQFNSESYPDAQGMIDGLHDKGIKVMAWITPLTNLHSKDDPNIGKASNYDYALENGYFINDGQTFEWWKGWGSFIDYTNPDALEWWHNQMDQVLDLGIDGWKTDAGNRVFPESTNGYNGRITQKEYSYLYYKDFYEYSLKSRGQHAIIFAKPYDENPADSTFVPKAYTPAAFVGDQTHFWGDSGLLNALNNVFETAKNGFVAIGSDIGGFMGEMNVTKSLLIRWAQFGAFCPIMENGGGGEHRPWMFDQETVDIYRYYAKLHSQLVPYLYSYGVLAHNGGKVIIRPMDGVWQYMLGRDLFVSTIFQDVTSREVTLPEGTRWVDYWNDDVTYDSGQTLSNYDCPIDQYPVFIRSGGIVPMYVKDDETGHGSSASAGKLTVLVYPDGTSSLTFYDENHTTEFECVESSDVVTVNVSSAADDYIFRIKYKTTPSIVTLNSSEMQAYAEFSQFEAAQTGWYYNEEKHYVWIKTGAKSGNFNMSIAPQTTAAFSADPLTGETPLDVQFTDESVHAVSWQWDFGDGSELSTDQNPVHTYTDPGSYDVTLTVTGASGSDSIEKLNLIQVGSSAHAFTDITSSAGVHVSSVSGSHGAGFADANKDGRYDIFVANSGEDYNYDFMYMNQGGATFQQSSSSRGVDDEGHTFKIVNADFDNDGDLDVFYANQPIGNNYVIGVNKLYQNDGNGYYTDISDDAGIPQEYSNSQAALAADFNGDGWLDLYVANWDAENAMYLNDGTGKMIRVHNGSDGDGSGIYKSVSVSAADVDNDNDVDLYVSRHEQPNWLFINNGSGYFSERAASAGVDMNARSKGVSFADVDNDGDMDLFLAKYSLSSGGLPQVGIFFNRGNGTFHDRSSDYNIQSSLYSILLMDADNDADVDMLVVRNNQKEDNAVPQMYLNDGSGQFTYQLFPGLEVPAKDAQSAAYADIDNDGDVDVFLTCEDGSNYLLRNDLEYENNYIDILCKGAGGDYGGFGSRVYVYKPGYLGDNNNLIGYQQSTSSSAYLGQNQTALHFGLNGYSSCDVRVVLSDGTQLDYAGKSANRQITVGGPVENNSNSVNAPNVHTPLPCGQNNLQLSWEAVNSVSGYHIYRDTTPFFEPDCQNGSNRLAALVTDEDPNAYGIQWTDTDPVLGDHEVNYYYVITSIKDGQESECSKHIGAFDYKLITTPSTDFNEIALSLSKADLVTAEDLMHAIPGCNSVAKWEPSIQGYMQYIPGLSSTNFDLAEGHPYYVNVTDSSVYSLSGELVNPNYQLITTPSTDFNEIMLPLDKYEITKASELMQEIPGCNSVAKWEPSIQGYIQYIPGLSSTDFTVRAGYPYYINITQDISWPEAGLSKSTAAKKDVITGNTPVHSPHAVYGELELHEEIIGLHFRAYLRNRPDDYIKSSGSGSLITDTEWFVQLSTIPGGWQAGEELVVEFYNEHDVLVGTVTKELSWNAADDAGLVSLDKVVTEYELHQNYPNPFNPQTTIQFGLPKASHVELFISDVMGRRVRTLINANRGAGYHRVVWTGVDDSGLTVASGIYFYSLHTGDQILRKKLVLVK